MNILLIAVDTLRAQQLSCYGYRHPTSPVIDDLAREGVLFEEMKAAEDPMEHYCSVMRRNAKRQDGSGLGLARIRAEAEMTLDHEVDDELVTIIARTLVPLVIATGGDA